MAIAIVPGSVFDFVANESVQCQRSLWVKRNTNAAEQVIHDLIAGKISIPMADYLAAQSITRSGAFALSRVARDDFKKLDFVIGQEVPFVPVKTFSTEENRGHVQLTGQKGEQTAATFFCTVHTDSASWSFWEELVDSSGRQFSLRREDSKVRSEYSLIESAYAVIPEEVLRNWATNDIKLRLYGKRTLDFTIPANAVGGFLQKCGEVFH